MGNTVSHETLRFVNPDGTQTEGKERASFEVEYFGEGTFRWAFKGTYIGCGPHRGQRCVVKVYKKSVAEKFSKWGPDLAVSQKAAKFAQKFNEIKIDIAGRKKIKFVIPLISKMGVIGGFRFLGVFDCGGDTRYVRKDEFVAIEPFLEGQFKKFNSNSGWESDDSALLPAFTHWTYEVSHHQFMVCDLQGVKYDSCYVLTDPVVHSAEQLYYGTGADLGVVGMEDVMKNHQCNFVCDMLRLPKYNHPGFIPRQLKRTTYYFDLTFDERERLKRKQNLCINSDLF